MDNREAFLARLHETFRVEASEHLQAITAGLLALERAPGTEHASILERVFRETHSLKGAARAVDLADVEALCQEMESIFAAMKRSRLGFSTEMLDPIHAALAVLVHLCGSSPAGASPESRRQQQQILAELRQVTRGIVGSASSPGAEPPAGTHTPSATPLADDRASTPSGGHASTAVVPILTVVPETVRVSTRKLGDILGEAEELVGARIAVSERAAALRALAVDLAYWNQRRVGEARRQQGGQGGVAVASQLIESEMLHNRALESSLWKVAGAAHQDALFLAAIADRLLEDAKRVLLLPCSHILGALPQVIRELARTQGKEADLVVSGEDIEIDRRVLDEIKDPLLHLVRNCIDHGIEAPDIRRARGKASRGSISISVKPAQGNRIELTLADDGSGIDAAKVKKAAVRLGLVRSDEAAGLLDREVAGLAFHSGLSTSPNVTELSGRGLGLAIVREKVEKLGGTIAMNSNPGAGTVFRMILPLSLVTFRGVFVVVAGRRFVIPTASVVRVSRIKPGQIKTVESRPTVAIGREVVPVVDLGHVLGLPAVPRPGDGAARPVVLARTADRQIGFLVDEVQGEQEVMVKSLGSQLTRVRNVAGAALSASGEVVPILNVTDLVQSASAIGPRPATEPRFDTAPARRRRLLAADDSITARTLVKNILQDAGYEVVVAVDGLDALTRLKAESFDLLVSDVDMPRLNGFELTAKVRADPNLSHLPVVLVTALNSQTDREYGIEVGANAYIAKSSFDQGNLLEIIRRLV